MAAYTPSSQVKLTNVAYVRLNKKGKRFEIACYRNKVLSWRNKVENDLREVLQIDQVFMNVSQGKLANSKDLLDSFGTNDMSIVCKEILDKGELQVSEKERTALFDSMIRDVAAIVADKSINPENNRPYTISMIQNAMKQIHYSVSINKSAKSQAIEVIRKLKDVMPIARASMLLRIVCPSSFSDDMSKTLREDIGLQIIQAVTSSESTNSSFDIRIDPELFRKVEESTQQVTLGQGRLEVLKFRDSVPVAPPNPIRQVIDNIENLAEKLPTNSIKSKSEKTNQEIVKKKTKKKITIQDDIPSTNRSRTQFFALNDDDDDDDNDESDEDIVKEEATEISIKVNATNDNDDVSTNIVETQEDSEEEYENDSSDEEVYGMVTKSKSKKNKSKTSKQQVTTNDIDLAIGELSLQESTDTKAIANKKSKKLKRIEKEETKEKQGKMDALKARIESEKAHSDLSHQSAATSLIHESNNERPKTSPIATTISTNSSSSNSSSAIATGKISLQSCNTCGGSFPDAAAYRSHFRSEWHRYNLKQKLKNLLVITSEEEFAKLPMSELDL